MTIPSAAGEGLHNFLPLTFPDEPPVGSFELCYTAFCRRLWTPPVRDFDPRPLEILSKRTQFGKSSPAFRRPIRRTLQCAMESTVKNLRHCAASVPSTRRARHPKLDACRTYLHLPPVEGGTSRRMRAARIECRRNCQPRPVW